MEKLNKSLENALAKDNPYRVVERVNQAAEKEMAYMSKDQVEKRIREVRKSMEKAAKELDFMQAAKFRDEIDLLQKQLVGQDR
jgi:excinuclease ABC subunit B